MAVTDLARWSSSTASSGAALLFAIFALALFSPSLARADCGCGSTDPLSACMGRSASYEVGGSTIEFQFRCDGGDCRCGQFANRHDYWVAPSSDGGTVTITGMTPAQTGSGSGLTNGAVADPSTTDEVQGWNGSLRYEPSLTVKVPYVVNTSSVGRPVVLMKARSHPSNTPSDTTYCNNERMCLEHVEALTIVASPPGDVFRPPYFGTEKPMIPASRFDVSVLPSLAPTGKEDSYASALSSVTSVAVDHMWSWSTRQLFHPKVNYGTPHSGYDGYVTQNELGANLTMLLQPRNAAEAAQRELLARRVAQRGIDLYYIFKNGGQDNHPMCGGWFGTGGFGTGRLPTILISTTLLGMHGSWGEHLDQVLSTTEGRQCFAETSLIQPPNPRGKNVPLFGHITTSVYTVSGGKTAADPRGLIDGGGNATSACVSAYQSCCTSAIFRGGAMAMWLVPAVMERFPAGAAHWLQFVDRTTTVGAYCSADSFEATPYNENYPVPGANELYSQYRACSKNYSCAGMSNPGRVSNPGPPLAPVLLD